MTLTESAAGRGLPHRSDKQTIYTRFPELAEIPRERFPRHVLIIPDGDVRWASAAGESSLYGHSQGALAALPILRDLRELPIDVVTLWGFSSDNWKRPQQETGGIMKVLEYHARDQKLFEELMENNARFVHLGRKKRIPPSLAEAMRSLEIRTARNTGQIICLAVDFGGWDQEVRIGKKLRQVSFDDPRTTEELILEFRDGYGLIPEANLLIRTSGEHRTSDIGWLNGAGTELYFIDDKYFPQIETADVVQGIIAYTKRDIRKGGRTTLTP